MKHARTGQDREGAKRAGDGPCRYLSVREAAEIAGGLTERQIRKLCHRRRLYATRKRSQWRIPRERFLAHIGAA